MRLLLKTLLGLAFITSCHATIAGDWPQWRYDAGRTAVSPEVLPDSLQLQWSRRFAPRVPAWDDPLNRDLMSYDRQLEPIAIGGRLYIGFSDTDCLTAFDLNTGRELWTFYADGPVRLPAAGEGDKVCFASDDGCLYCVDAETGTLNWKFRGAPNAQQSIGNQRLISSWPARGGPVIRDGKVYFAAGIWPMMGTFLYALDINSGRVHWINDSTGAQYIKQPHSAPSFAGVAPQGALVATERDLVVPGGRSVPAVFNRENGQQKYFELNAGGKGTGGSFVAATNTHFYVHTRGKGTRQFRLQDGVKTAFQPDEPVLQGDVVYSAAKSVKQSLLRATTADGKPVWEVQADGSGDLILAGRKLYAGGETQISVVTLPDDNAQPAISQQVSVGDPVARLLAADGKLIAVTQSGRVLVFGKSSASQSTVNATAGSQTTQVPADRQSALNAPADRLLQVSGNAGYACVFAPANGELVRHLAANSGFQQMAVYDTDADRVKIARRSLRSAGLYGRVTVHVGTPALLKFPPCVFNLVVIDTGVKEAFEESTLEQLYESVRPYGGVLNVLTAGNAAGIAERLKTQSLANAEIAVTPDGVQITRSGRLPGSADWTHQYGDIANTLKSDDARVKLPLGVLWFGGNTHDDVLPRHGHGPPEQVVGGRLFIQGINSLSARDVYTGRVLWKREFQDLGTLGVYYDQTYDDTPLDTKYNQIHIPGANGRGTNYVVTDDRVYLIEGSACHVLDPATGKTLQDIQLPALKDGTTPAWGYIGVYHNLLLAGRGFADYQQRFNSGDKNLKEESPRRAAFGPGSLNRAASRELLAFDRHTGKLLWEQPAQFSFWHNGIVAGGGRIYCLDRHPREVEDMLRRRGKAPEGKYRILCLDAHTGKPAWEIKDNVFGTWLGYSENHDLLLQAGAAAKDRLSTEVGQGMAVCRAADGQLKWYQPKLAYAGPCILHHDWIITNTNSYSDSAGAFHIVTGEPKLVANPLTGEPEPWTMTRAYGCNNIIACEHLLTFRSGAAGYYDLAADGGTGNFGGFKSGCTSNLVAANGVLNAPDYTRTCSCSYQNQTSLALVHMPGLEYWTIHPSVDDKLQDGTIRQLALNLGAPGDRRDKDGLLWLEYPAVAGGLPAVTVKFNDGVEYFQQQSQGIADDDHAWVFASGVAKVTDVLLEWGSGRDSSGDAAVHRYNVKLYFASPRQYDAGERRFAIRMQEQDLGTVSLSGPAATSGGIAVRSFPGIRATNRLQIRFTPQQGVPVLCGISLERADGPSE